MKTIEAHDGLQEGGANQLADQGTQKPLAPNPHVVKELDFANVLGNLSRTSSSAASSRPD